MSAQLQLVVFDVDGTLVDSQAQILAAMQPVFASENLPAPPADEVRGIIGLSLPQAFAQLCPDSDSLAHLRMTEAYKTAAIALRETSGKGDSPLFPGIKGLLDHLHQHCEMLLGVATGKSMRGLRYTLASHGIATYFATCQAADTHPSKPHPSMLLEALDQTGTRAEDAVMIGDTTYDMEMARAANMRAIGVGWGYHAQERLIAAGAHRVVNNVTDLGRYLEDFRGDRT